jgi:hypothetical protein
VTTATQPTWQEIPRQASQQDHGFAPVVEQHECEIGNLRLSIFRRQGDTEYRAHAHVDGYCLGRSDDLNEAKAMTAINFLPILRQAMADLTKVIARDAAILEQGAAS